MKSHIISFFNGIIGFGEKSIPVKHVSLDDFPSFFDSCVLDIMQLDLIYIIYDLSQFYGKAILLVPLVSHFNVEGSGRRQQAFGEQIQGIISYCENGPPVIPDTEYLIEFIKAMKIKLKMLTDMSNSSKFMKQSDNNLIETTNIINSLNKTLLQLEEDFKRQRIVTDYVSYLKSQVHSPIYELTLEIKSALDTSVLNQMSTVNVSLKNAEKEYDDARQDPVIIQASTNRKETELLAIKLLSWIEPFRNIVQILSRTNNSKNNYNSNQDSNLSTRVITASQKLLIMKDTDMLGCFCINKNLRNEFYDLVSNCKNNIDNYSNKLISPALKDRVHSFSNEEFDVVLQLWKTSVESWTQVSIDDFNIAYNRLGNARISLNKALNDYESKGLKHQHASNNLSQLQTHCIDLKMQLELVCLEEFGFQVNINMPAVA